MVAPPRRPLVTAGLAIGLAVTAARDARAHHTEEQRLTDDTAYTLQKSTVRLGLFKQQWGPWDRITFGTYAVPWVVGFANAHVKWRYFGGDPLSLSASLGLSRFAPKAVKESVGSAELGIVPLELGASYRFDERLTVSGGLLYTVVTLKGSYDAAALDGLAAVSNLQLFANLEVRATRVTAFVLAGRYLAFQNTSGRLSATFRPDAFTSVEVQSVGATNALDFPQAFSIVPSVVFSWGTFNLRAGLGYGNYSVPMVNLVLPKKTVVPDLDLYFVF